MAVGTAMVGRPPRCRGWSCQPQGASRSSTGSHSDAMIDEDSPIGFLLANENARQPQGASRVLLVHTLTP